MYVVISEFADASTISTLELAGAKVTYSPDLWRETARLTTIMHEADALIVRNQTNVTAELLSAGTHLKVVGRLGVGLDNIDLKACRSMGVIVCSARSANATAVAEYVMAAMLTMARRLDQAKESVRSGLWDRQGFTGTELAGKTLGIVGVGDIGVRLARRAQAFGMRVVAHDPFVPPFHLVVAEMGVQLLTLDELVGVADVLSLHVPLTDMTRLMINADRLALVKPGAWLINTARGGIVDEIALAASLQSGRLGGAVLDVLTSEPPAQDHPLLRAPNCLITPHIAGLTRESSARVASMVATDVLRGLRGAQPFGWV